MAGQGSKAVVKRDDETAVAPTLLDQARQRLIVAEEVAKLLTEKIVKHKLFSEIVFKKREGGKVVGERKSKHVRFEGWTTAGVLLEFISGDTVHPVTVWTKPLPYPEGKGPSDYPQGTFGYAAKVEARTSDGRVVGGAETSVTRDEARWRNADDYAIQSMAQTRAGSKALRSPLGWLIALAGFDQTPAEEMEGLRNGAEPRSTPRGGGGRGAPTATGKQWLCPKCDKEDGKRIWNPPTSDKCGKCGCPRPGTTAPAKVTSRTPISEGDALDAAMAQAEAEGVQTEEPSSEPPDGGEDDEPDPDQLKAEDAARDAAEDAAAEDEAEAADDGGPYP